MRQVRIKKGRMTDSCSSERSIVLPLDPRDEDIVRAKALRRREHVGRRDPYGPCPARDGVRPPAWPDMTRSEQDREGIHLTLADRDACGWPSPEGM
jgi:hypothetical protein